MGNNSIKRDFILGEEWTYYKIYLGTNTADRVLEEALKPAIHNLLKKNKIDSWFFIRYSDPDYHLRLRLHYVKSSNIGAIISRIYKALRGYSDNGLIWKVQTDTYNREIERYGKDTMKLSERLFFIDSEMYLRVLPLFMNKKGEVQRWLLAMKMTDALLECFRYELQDRTSFMFSLKEDFGNEFGMNKSLKDQLNEKFQKERKLIENSICSYDQSSILSPFSETLNFYKESVRPLASEILYIYNESPQKIQINDLVRSYIHMTMNRIFISKQRVHEMVIYDFLFRYYKLLTGRLKADDKKNKDYTDTLDKAGI